MEKSAHRLGKGNKYKAMCFALRHADKVIANSDFTRDTLIGMGVSARRIVPIHPGVDNERFRPACVPTICAQVWPGAASKLVLSVGR